MGGYLYCSLDLHRRLGRAALRQEAHAAVYLGLLADRRHQCVLHAGSRRCNHHQHFTWVSYAVVQVKLTPSPSQVKDWFFWFLFVFVVVTLLIE